MVLSWDIPVFCTIGLILGIVLGVLPGISGLNGLAFMIAPTFLLEPLQGLCVLTGIFTGSLVGGGFTAVLLNIPGDPVALMTCLDGYPLTKQGRQNEALGIVLMASVLGCFVGWIFILFLLVPIGRFVLRFGPSEMLALFGCALTIVGAIGGNIWKAILMGLFGLLLATIGATPYGRPRGISDMWILYEGIPLEPLLIGLLAVSELPILIKEEFVMGKFEKAQQGFRSILQGFALTLREKRTLLRSILIGLGIGILPAAGSIIATTVSYGQARRASKHPERFGHGEVAGVVAAESADNASEPGSMATMMCLGIPGGAATAIIIAAFMYHGMSPGPYLIRDHLDFAYAIILANFLQAFLMLGLGILFCYYTGWIVFVPTRVLVPIIVLITFGGILALRGHLIDLWISVIFGAIGYLLRRYDYPILALILGFILGGRVEEQFVRTKLLFANEYHSLLYRPIFMVLVLGLVGSFVLPPIIRYLKRRRRTEKV